MLAPLQNAYVDYASVLEKLRQNADHPNFGLTISLFNEEGNDYIETTVPSLELIALFYQLKSTARDNLAAAYRAEANALEESSV